MDDFVPKISWKEIKVGKLIGSGAFGEVYEGTWRGNSVAIKQLFLKKLSNDLMKDFADECSLLYRCRFPQIVQLYGVCVEEGHYAMLLEFLPKGSLYDVLHDKSEPLPWNPLRWKIAIGIARGVEYLHDTLKIVHRDLKSQNIVLDKEYSPKITDFGLSTIKLETTTSTVNAKGKGSVRWMAPELFMRRAKATFASDVYSFGMILWELTSRKIPFADAMNETIAATWIAGGQKEDLEESEVPQIFNSWIQKCWDTDPNKRPPIGSIAESLQKEKPIEPTNSLGIEKCWHFDPSLLTPNFNSEKSLYVLVDATPKDKQKVVQQYLHHPVPNMDIKSVKAIFNPQLRRHFELRLTLLDQRHNNSSFQPKWKDENNSEWRSKVIEMAKEMSAPYKDNDAPHVSLLPVWHGTNPSALQSIFSGGYANLATTDGGYFGKGIYGSHEAEYAYRVYSKGALILNWVSFYSAYPVIHGDMSKLQEKGNYQNYDAHFVPVIPSDGQFSFTCKSYYPCKPNQKHQYTEVVVFDSAQCLPQYLVELQPSFPASLKLSSKFQSEQLFMWLEDTPLSSLEECALDLRELKLKGNKVLFKLPQLISSVKNKVSQMAQPIPNLRLSIDERAAIYLYTMELKLSDGSNGSIHYLLNEFLRNEDKGSLAPFMKYFKLLLRALYKLPPVKGSVCEGAKTDITLTGVKSQEHKEIIWKNFASAIPSSKILENPMDFDTGKRVMFFIDCKTGRDISALSAQRSEAEILLLPYTSFMVDLVLEQGDLTIVNLTETDCVDFGELFI